MSENLKGRLDLVLARLVEEGCKRAQAVTGFDFWNGLPEHGQSGMKQITEDLIDQAGIPRVAIDLPRTLAAGLVEFVGGGSDDRSRHPRTAESGEATRSPHAPSGRARPRPRKRNDPGIRRRNV